MKSNEVSDVKLDKLNVDPLSNYNKPVKARLVVSENASFLDFMNDQLNFSLGSETTTSETTTQATDKTKEKDKTKSTTTDKEVNSAQKEKQIDKESLLNENKKDRDFVDQFLKIDAKQLSLEDMKQVQQILNTNGFSININQIMGFNNYPINYNGTKYSSGSMGFAKNLSEMLNDSYKTNKPIRIDFENNSSVIFKIDKDGKLSAQFLSSDKAMELLLKENLYLLRAKLEKEGLPYKELSYKDSSDNKQERRSEKER